MSQRPDPEGPPSKRTYLSKGLKLKSSVRLDAWRHIGYRLLLLGMTPENFMEKFSVRHALVYLIFFLTHSLYSAHELTVALFFSRSLLERVTHGYILTYIFTFNLQWYYMLRHVGNFHRHEMSLENFASTQAHLDFAEEVFNKNINAFLKYLFISMLWWATNTTTHVFGPLVETVLMYVRSGDFKLATVLPQVFSLPMWAQVIMYIHNATATILLFVYCLASYLVLGTRVLKVKTQCDILNEALRRDYDEESNIRSYIKDHINIIKSAKLLNGHMQMLNGIIFTACYLEFATQMFALTLFEPSGAYFFALAFDLMSIMLILVMQCWFASIVTISLQSVTDAVYETNWYRRDKDNSLNVLMMLQMAQQDYIQRIWFKSFKIERAAILNLIRSSYAVYTALLIFQE
uniref:Odorant receptor n=1 Tax=Apolygus lucorum TaxID=248454 RepID=A0A1Q1NIK5_APOLU|nr:olfactory receptor [Apolygus lucorum]